MTERIIVAGEGGQGIMLLGKVLAEAGMLGGKYVTWLPAYGAEVRGGTAHCMVTLSDSPIGSPYIEKADTAIILNSPSFGKFKNRVKQNGVFFVNSSLVEPKQLKGFRMFWHPFTSIAVETGNIKVANMVAIGCLLAFKEVVTKKSVLAVIQNHTPADRPQIGEVNRRALEEGMKLA